MLQLFLRGFGGAGVVLGSLGGTCFGASNGVFSLMLRPVCVVVVVLVWCYDRSATHVSVLATT